MSKVRLSHSSGIVKTSVRLPGSKSESNRMLMMNALSGIYAPIENLSSADDTRLMQVAISSEKDTINLEGAGTCMRFLTAYFCATNKRRILTGNERMKERTIAPLVNALSEIGFDIRYTVNEGFPPVEIIPIKDFSKLESEVFIDAGVSSQFISALMMIAPFLPKGLIIKLSSNVASFPYLEMTQVILAKYNVRVDFSENQITIPHTSDFRLTEELVVGADWTSASYWYSIALLAKESEILLEGLQNNWTQGDRVMADWMKRFGVSTQFTSDGVWLKKSAVSYPTMMKMNFKDNPDLAQTFAAMFAGAGIYCTFSGLESLKIKETDRVAALQMELSKFSVRFDYSERYDFYQLKGEVTPPSQTIATYSDHRMAMAFAPLALLFPVEIDNADVVAKSYPGFWTDLSKAGFQIQ